MKTVVTVVKISVELARIDHTKIQKSSHYYLVTVTRYWNFIEDCVYNS